MHGERRSVTYDGIEYAPGAKFRVLKHCSMNGFKPSGHPGALDGWRQALEPGDIITCLGYGPGWGSDPGYGVEFTSDAAEAVGAFHLDINPQAGGIWDYRPQPGLLEPA